MLRLSRAPGPGLAPFAANVAATRTGDARASAAPGGNGAGPGGVSVTFRKRPPTGWVSHDASAFLQTGVKFISTRNDSIPDAFRTQARRNGKFEYRHRVNVPGLYTVRLGFVEFQTKFCTLGARVFRGNVNGKGIGKVDVFKKVACFQPFVKNVKNVPVGDDGFLVVKLVGIDGATPILNNFQLVRVMDFVDPVTSPAVVTSVSAIPSITPAAVSSSPVSSPVPSTSADPSVIPSSSPTPSSEGVAASSLPAPEVPVLSADVGGGSKDRAGAVEGSTKIFPNVFAIEGAQNNAKFSKHRFGVDFSYIFNVPPMISYSVRFFFAESFKPGCQQGFRLFDVSVFDQAQGVASGKTISNIDVFQTVGCRTAYTTIIEDVFIGESGRIELNFKGVKENAMVSAFDIFSRDPNFGGLPSKSPVPQGPKKLSVKANIGTGPTDIFAKGTQKSKTALAVTGTDNVDASNYQTSRFGTDFTFSFNLEPGAYDIILGFAEYFQKFCNLPGNRVFNVYVNDLIQLEGYDIFATAGCNKGVEVKLTTSVGVVDTQPVRIHFVSISNFATVSYVSIKPGKKECIPASDSGSLSEGEDHAAHAVPGSYPPQLNANSPKTYVDSAGKGFVNVRINGDGSHTHFFDSADNIIGVVTDYTWTLMETGEVISKKVAFNYDFPLGVTRLKLTVMDNSCTTDEAETTVTVTGAIQPGQYCYYYAGLTAPPVGGTLLDEPRPQFAKVSKSSALGFPSFSFEKSLFSVRCLFFLEVDADSTASSITVATFGTGDAKVYKGGDLIIDSTSSDTAETSLSVGLIAFEVVYRRTSLAMDAKLHFLVDGKVPADKMITHDRTTVVPVLTTISPSEGQSQGGTRVKISGYGLFQPLKVSFGDSVVEVLNGAVPTQFFVKSPPEGDNLVVDVTVTSESGTMSNPLKFSYGTACDSVAFTDREIVTADGDAVDNLNLPTCATIGQDGKIYMGTLGGTIQVLGYDSDLLTVTSQCYSKKIVDLNFQKDSVPSSRDFLGIAFDPRDKLMMPYVSSATLFWHDRNRVDLSNMAAWRNGAIDRFEPGTDPMDKNVCLVYQKRVVSGLPVSNHDHSVNGLLFTQKGDLLIAVGGFANLGLPGYKLGGYWETTLSASILIAELSKPNFDGDIKYSNDLTPRLAKKISGDVELYSTGLRNTFAMTMLPNGEIYASDQGPNCSFGDTAVSCDDYNEEEAAKWDPNADVDWKGTVKHESGKANCPYSLGRPDKILHITKGNWYGHPNIQRGGDECAWIDPFNDKTVDGKSPGSTSNYKKPLVTVKSPVTGIEGYGSNHFCGKLRGELILSTHKGGNTYRMGVNGDKTTSGPDEISPTGGITFVENARGDLIFPRLTAKKVFVLRPKVGLMASVFVAGAVPFRHGKMGGSMITIGGSNFGADPSVSIGASACVIVRKTDREIVCTVPAASGGALLDLTVTSISGESSTLPKAVLYMEV